MKTQFTQKEIDKWYSDFDANDRAKYELASALERAIDVLGLEWTTDIFEEVTKRKVDR